MAKSEHIDCVEMKRKAQRRLAEALAGHSPAEQVEILRRSGEKTPFWQRITSTNRTRPAKSIKPSAAKRKKSA